VADDTEVSWAGRRWDSIEEGGQVADVGIYTVAITWGANGPEPAGPVELAVPLPAWDWGVGTIGPPIRNYDWSPDGSAAVMSMVNPSALELSDGTVLHSGYDMYHQVRWSPEGGQIVFGHDHGTADVIPAEGGAATSVLESSKKGLVEEPSWSPSGTHLVYNRKYSRSIRGQGWQWDIYVCAADGSGEARVVRDVGSDPGPEWRAE
jgi:hypothetical protein